MRVRSHIKSGSSSPIIVEIESEYYLKEKRRKNQETFRKKF